MRRYRLLFSVSFLAAASAAGLAPFAPACGGQSAAQPSPSADAAGSDTPSVDATEVESAPDAAAPTPALTCAAPYDTTSDDPHNCGAPGRDCLGATCSQGLCAPQVLLPPPSGWPADGGAGFPTAAAVDDQNIYFLDGTTVDGIPKAGGATFTVATAPGSGVDARVVIGGGAVYWAFPTFPTGTDNSIELFYSAPTSARGAQGTLIGSTMPIGSTPWQNGGNQLLGVVGQTLYWADPCKDILSLSTIGGGTPSPFYTSCPFLPDGGFPTGDDGPAVSIVLDPISESLFVDLDEYPAAAVERVQLPGGAAQALPALANPYPTNGFFHLCLAVANGSAYVSTGSFPPPSSMFTFFSVPIDGAGAWTYLTDASCSPVGRLFAVDGSHAYMINPLDPNGPGSSYLAYARVVRLDLRTGTAVRIYDQVKHFPSDPLLEAPVDVLAIDDQFIYMETELGIVRVAK